jgi:probable rRNA maturation factor
MRALNKEHRGMDRTTDVLSFPQFAVSPGPMGRPSRLQASQLFLLGDIVINLHKAERQADEYGVPLDAELKRLAVHGLLHLLGYDHESGGYAAKKMKKKEKELIELC